ncbi:MAG: ROK family transcriptional regulator [Geminicoccaceae bacterium]
MNDGVRRSRRATEISRGTNLIGVRQYNERLILSLIRQHGRLSKAEIARQTGLSAQTVTIIMRQLQADRLVLTHDPIKGRVGQPSVPFALDPEGAFGVGLKIGRRSADAVLLDFAGRIRGQRRQTHAFPEPAEVMAFFRTAVGELVNELASESCQRIAGIGVAAPFELWGWEAEIGAPSGSLKGWRYIDIVHDLGLSTALPVQLCNDATGACAAELVLGSHTQLSDFLYVFIGSFVGGGVVLDGRLFAGRTGNAGALGSMPMGPEGEQLIKHASIAGLDRAMVAAGLDATVLWRQSDDWGQIGPVLDRWIDEVSKSLATTVVAAISVIDFEAVIIDGAFPSSVRDRLVSAVSERLETMDRSGLSPVKIEAGSIGSNARAIGGACLPLLTRFARDQDVLLKAVS